MKTKRFRFIISIVMICAIVFSLNGMVMATEETVDLSMYSFYEIRAGIVPGITWNQEMQAAYNIERTARSPIVCVMRIYSDNAADSSVDLSNGNVGHTFLTFLNVSSSNIKVGRETVAPNKMVSVSKFGNFKEHANYYKGVFYNVETQRRLTEPNNYYTGAVSTYLDLTATELATVSSYFINNQDGYNFAINNCAQFCSRIWNTIVGNSNSEKYLDVFATPYDVRLEIQKVAGYTTGGGLLLASYTRCYYDGTTRTLCSDPRLD